MVIKYCISVLHLLLYNLFLKKIPKNIENIKNMIFLIFRYFDIFGNMIFSNPVLHEHTLDVFAACHAPDCQEVT